MLQIVRIRVCWSVANAFTKPTDCQIGCKMHLEVQGEMALPAIDHNRGIPPFPHLLQFRLIGLLVMRLTIKLWHDRTSD